MLKRFAVLAMFFAVTQALMPVVGQTPDKTAKNSYQQGNPTNTGKNPVEKTTPVDPNTNGGANQLKAEQGKSDNDQVSINVCEPTSTSIPWTWHEKIAWGAGLLLVVFGIWGVQIAVRTLKNVERQTKAAVISAKAARRQTIIAMNAQRAWVMGTLENVPAWHPDPTRLEFMDVKPVFRNYGETPGKILSIHMRVQYLADEEQLAEFPVYKSELWDSSSFFGEIALMSKNMIVQPISVRLAGVTFPNVKSCECLSIGLSITTMSMSESGTRDPATSTTFLVGLIR
jgi:hypothetical protein